MTAEQQQIIAQLVQQGIQRLADIAGAGLSSVVVEAPARPGDQPQTVAKPKRVRKRPAKT